MQSARNLRVYEAAAELAERTYRVVRLLPIEERFALAQQMRRSAVSVGSNVAEGCGRDGNGELTHFLRIALGSATELEFQLTIAVRLALLTEQEVADSVACCRTVQRMLTRLIVAVRPVARASRGRPKTDKP